ncbi:MAG: hypothetical protein SOU08_00085 [Anaerococcus sp.]|nr:hypothetical protein [Anaerococcus sp.]
MIKVYNQKPLEEIEELRQMGIYNAPFSVLEAANKVEVKADTKELEEEVAKMKIVGSKVQVDIYNLMIETKKELELEQSKSMVEMYQMVGGMK